MLGLPLLIQQAAGRLSEFGLVHLLLSADAQRLSGTLQLSGDHRNGAPSRRLLIEAGEVVAGDFGDRGLGLLSELLPLCSRDCGYYRFTADTDLLGGGRHVLRGRVDAYMVASVVFRESTPLGLDPHRFAATVELPLRVAPGQTLSRFGLNRDEWNFVQDVRRNSGSFSDVLSRGLIEAPLARRLVTLFLLTGVFEVTDEVGVRVQMTEFPHSSAISMHHSMPVRRRSGVRPAADRVGELRDLLAFGELADGQASESTPVPLRLPGADINGRWFEAERRRRHAELLTRQHCLTEALSHVDSALALEPVAVESLALKAYLLWRLSPDPLQPDTAALELVDRALRIDPSCERAHQVRAQLLRALGREDEAFGHFARGSSHDELRDITEGAATSSLRRGTPAESLWSRLRRSIPPFRRVG